MTIAACSRCLILVMLFSVTTQGHAQGNDEAWQALREGRALLMLRHALAPGTGDPSHFVLGDCSSQRNLSAQGRAQARAWQALLASHDITEARVFTSQWCRSRDTATGMAVGEVIEWPALNSFFRNRNAGPGQIRETIRLVNDLGPGLSVILVSHQVNITALTGVFPASNEGIVIALPLSESPTVLGRVSPSLR